MTGTEPGDVIRRAKRLERDGRLDEALALLRDALRRGTLDAERVEAAGRFLDKALARAGTRPGERAAPCSIVVLGQCTTDWLTNALTAEAWGRGARVVTQSGAYDSVLQELSALERAPDVVVLLPWHQRLLASEPRAPLDRAQDELAFWRQAWELVPARSRLVQVGYDWTAPGALGYQLGARLDGDVRAVRRANELLAEHLPAGAYFVDLEQVAGELGRERFYDARNYFWTKQPFTSAGSHRLARHLWAGVRAVTTGPKKVLVLDLDNTLWGGVVGEVGPLGIELGDSPEGEAYRSFQRLVKALAARGVVLAACSKNNPEDAREPFAKNGDMVLSLADFAGFEASWDPKPLALERLAASLQLGLDSFVYFDDDPAEREQVLQRLPAVEVVDVPEDPADFGRSLLGGLWFEAAALTGADRERAEQYRAEGERRAARDAAGSLDEYLASLAMRAELLPIDDQVLPRVVQLAGKTNQFNLTTRRHSHERFRELVAQPDAVGFAIRLRDRFGDHGIVSVVVGEPVREAARQTLRLDTWLMSCRVIGRGLEDLVMNELAESARERGFEVIVGEYIPTQKNAQVADLYPRFGFAPLASAGEVQSFVLALAAYTPRKTFVAKEGERPQAP